MLDSKEGELLPCITPCWVEEKSDMLAFLLHSVVCILCCCFMKLVTDCISYQGDCTRKVIQNEVL